MSSARTKRPDQESVPQIPQSTPFPGGYSQPGHDFTLQAVMEMQKSVGELSANIQALKSSIDSVKTKVDDLVTWKHRIVGGAAVLGVVATLLGFMIAKASDYVTLKPPTSAAQTPGPPATQAPPLAPQK